MIKVRWVVLFMLLSSCQKEEIHCDIVGSYKTIDYASPIRLYQDITGVRRVVGLSLELGVDSTFVFGNCTSLSYGYWRIDEGLNLHVDTTIYKPHFLDSKRCVSVPENRGNIIHFEIMEDKLLAKLSKTSGERILYGLEKMNN